MAAGQSDGTAASLTHIGSFYILLCKEKAPDGDED